MLITFSDLLSLCFFANKKAFLGNVLIVVVFCAILAALFIAYDAVIGLVENLFK